MLLRSFQLLSADGPIVGLVDRFFEPKNRLTLVSAYPPLRRLHICNEKRWSSAPGASERLCSGREWEYHPPTVLLTRVLQLQFHYCFVPLTVVSSVPIIVACCIARLPYLVPSSPFRAPSLRFGDEIRHTARRDGWRSPRE